MIGTQPRLIASSPPSTKPQCPAHLGEVERAIWDDVVAEWTGSGVAFRVLASGLEAHQRSRECREIIEQEGMTIVGDRGVMKAHPLLTVERDARKQFQAVFKSLGIRI